MTDHILSVLTESLISLMDSDRSTGHEEGKKQSISCNRNSAHLLGRVAVAVESFSETRLRVVC